MNFFSSPYNGYSHGDIVVEVGENQITVIGGNVGREGNVDKRFYPIVKGEIAIDFGGLDIYYATTGAISVGDKQGALTFVGLRCDNQSEALKMVAKAKEEYELWKSKGWGDDSNPESFNTLAKYYDAPGLFYPSPNETQTSATGSTT